MQAPLHTIRDGLHCPLTIELMSKGTVRLWASVRFFWQNPGTTPVPTGLMPYVITAAETKLACDKSVAKCMRQMSPSTGSWTRCRLCIG